MLEVLEKRRAWITQRMANRYPPWAKVRKLAQSVGQQILEPMGRDFEEIYWWENYNLGNAILNTNDINQIDGISRLNLPSNFEFRTNEQVDNVAHLTPTSVRGKVDGSWITLSQANKNSLEEFWYGTPTRITSGGESHLYNPVLASTKISRLGNTVSFSPAVPGKLWVTLSNNGASIKYYKGSKVRSSVTLIGRDIYSRNTREKLYFAFNGTIQTKVAWSEVESISTEYIDSVAYLRVDWLNIGQTQVLDINGLHVTNDREKFRFWQLGSQSYGSTLQHSVFSADNLTLVEEGEDSKHSEYEIELLDSAGSNINGFYLAQWPKRRWVVITDSSKLHFYIPDIRKESLELLAEATLESVVQIGMDKEWSYKGDTIVFDYIMKRPFIRVLRTRLSAVKPDGSRVGIAPDGSEIGYGPSAWVSHPHGTTFRRTGFQGENIEYQITERGKYVFSLESIITDILTTEGQSRPANHIDVRVLHSAYDTAEASLSLPNSVGHASVVGFDGWMRPWVMDSGGTVHLLEFHHDVYLADFKNKAILLREEYTDLEVDA